MKIVLIHDALIPVKYYGGTERIAWYLAKELVKLGHDVTIMAKQGSHCDFTRMIQIDETKNLYKQIPAGADILHFHYPPQESDKFSSPIIVTMHGNPKFGEVLNINTVFVSGNHAERHGSSTFVYNGLDWDDYTKPDLTIKRKYFHFLGNAAWRVKNVGAAIDLVKASKNEKLKVLGGSRFNFRMGMRFTFSPKIDFYKAVGGEEKDKLLNASKGLIFPVRWHEPFGLAIIESLYYGCPVFATPYGSLPELIIPQVGYLSNNADELLAAMQNWNVYSSDFCHHYALEKFHSKKMCENYILMYHRVLSGEQLNQEKPVLKEKTPKFLEWND